MNLDAQLQFSASQALTATAVSTNIIDLGVARQIGVGLPMVVLINVLVAADYTSSNETYSFALQTDDNSAFSSPVTLFDTAIAAGLLTLGAQHVLAVPVSRVERYIRLNYTLGGTTPLLTVSAFLQPFNMLNLAGVQYPDAITIS